MKTWHLASIYRMTIMFWTLLLFGSSVDAQIIPAATPKMYFSDTSRIGRPFAKDPSVIKFKGKYWMYYSLPAATSSATNDAPAAAAKATGWGIGIANSSDLIHWTKRGEIAPEQEIEKAGIAAPGARVLNGKIELFYQTYGYGKRDAICHATSIDGIHFDRDPSNPVYRPTKMAWSVGRAIDAEVYPHQHELWLFFATRDPTMKIQQVGMAAAPLGSSYGHGMWHDLSIDAPILKPELPWEQTCIEAPSVLRHGKLYYLFYAGAYNVAPQQIGVATSKDGKTWVRQSNMPLLANGPPGSWNSSESGHPGVFADDDGRSYLFFQGNNDGGKTWFISMLEIRWHGSKPYLTEPSTN
jgi:sucrose-6-phosphate hydrolase SacC (GH32 family)